MDKPPVVSRRSLVIGGAAALLGATASGQARAAGQPAGAGPAPTAGWDEETDIICVGSGAGGLTSAIVARSNGDAVIILEKRSMVGGTTAKSGGIHWIPNNFVLRQQGVDDRKEDVLAFMARYAFPQHYIAGHPTLGIPRRNYELFAAFYDNASVVVDKLIGMGVYKASQWTMAEMAKRYHPDMPVQATSAPDYFDHAAENKVSSGRALLPHSADDQWGYGSDLVERFESWLTSQGQDIRKGQKVVDLIRNPAGDVIGVIAETKGKALRIRARKGVIFATGGYAQNEEMRLRFQRTRIYGSCAASGAQGDFIPIAGRAGAALDNMGGAWRGPLVLEEALAGPLAALMFFSIGDSMIYVNRYGRRMVDEWRSYHSRALAHHQWDSTKEEYPNHLAIMIFDQRTADIYGGVHPIPHPDMKAKWIIPGQTLSELSANIAARLASLREKGVDVRLANDFQSTLEATIKRYNGFARTGVDADFGRGGQNFDLQNFYAWSQPRDKAAAAMRKQMKNPTMYPIAGKGPYYAVLVGEGVLDTNGGPAINAKGQVIDYAGRPIPGLYGTGNCIGSPARDAYFAGGATIGMAMTFGYIAANAAHSETVKTA